jgi:hypothetical protein
LIASELHLQTNNPGIQGEGKQQNRCFSAMNQICEIGEICGFCSLLIGPIVVSVAAL